VPPAIVAAHWRGPAPARTAAAASSSIDPDEYDPTALDAVDDPDEHEALERAAAAPRGGGAAAADDGAAGPPSASGAPPRPREEAGAALGRGFNLFLLFGAAVDRAATRLHAGAAAAAGRAVDAAAASPAGRAVGGARARAAGLARELPPDAWGRLLWLWDRPPVQRLRLTISMANLSIRLPAILALVATQVGLLASQVSLPMLAPLLLGTGMLLRSVKANASFLFPRIGLLVVVFWLLWFANSVVQNTVAYLRRQGAVDQRLAGGVVTVSECAALVTAATVLLSMLGVNVSALLLPAGVAGAIAAKDLAHNFLAGFFLFVVQPFRVGDRLAVPSSAPGGPAAGGAGAGWFEGVAERVDLRYTMIRAGRRRLMVPNSAFLTREFMVLEDAPAGAGGEPAAPPGGAHAQPFVTQDHRSVWQYVEGPPLHAELAREGAGRAAAAPPPPPDAERAAPGAEPTISGGGGGGNGKVAAAAGGPPGAAPRGAYGGGGAYGGAPFPNGYYYNGPGAPVQPPPGYWAPAPPPGAAPPPPLGPSAAWQQGGGAYGASTHGAGGGLSEERP
jgi:hypothetical protein